jgi:hypothetical protein
LEIVFVTIPRSFIEPHFIPQLNTINAIKRYNPRSKIVLYSDDPGVYDFAKNNDCIAPKIVKKIGNLPLVNCALSFAKDLFPESYICFINSDIMVMTDLTPIIAFMKNTRLKKTFVLTAYRKEANVENVLNGNDMDKLKLDNGLIRGRHYALDIFILHSGLISAMDMPNYRVGRIGWDSWIAGKVRKMDLGFVDISNMARIVHQDHPQVHDKTGWDTLWSDWSSHGISNFGSLIDCNYMLKSSSDKIYLNFFLKQHLYGTFFGRAVRALRRITLAFFREKIIKNFF